MTRLSISTVIKAALFVVIGVVAFSLMSKHAAIPGARRDSDYIVNFADVEGLVAGNPVKISGVRVGRVADIDPRPAGGRDRPRPRKGEDRTVPTRARTRARGGPLWRHARGPLHRTVRRGARCARRSGNEIPVTATTGPVNLTALMNGFAPLFSALDPKQVNDLAQGFVDRSPDAPSRCTCCCARSPRWGAETRCQWSGLRSARSPI